MLENTRTCSYPSCRIPATTATSSALPRLGGQPFLWIPSSLESFGVFESVEGRPVEGAAFIPERVAFRHSARA